VLPRWEAGLGNKCLFFKMSIPFTVPPKTIEPRFRASCEGGLKADVLIVYRCNNVECVWNLMAHGDAREGKWRGNWQMEWVASTLHTTSEHGVSSITTADAHTSAASSPLNWRPRRFKWTRLFRRKTKSGFCAWAITFQTHSTTLRDEFRKDFLLFRACVL